VNGARRPRDIEGIEFVSVESRPELLREAWPLAQQGYEDMPIEGLDILLEPWLQGQATLPAGSFVALAAGEIVGFAGLMRWAGDPSKAEHGFRVVRRDWCGRGLAAALKERVNENMQAVNTRLDYVTTAVTIAFRRSLPL
jgi:mycothiol synthase